MNYFGILLVSQIAVAFAATGCPAGYQEGGDNYCYKAYTTPQAFRTAAATCQADGGFVATVSNAFENSFIHGLTLHLNQTWIGYRCDSNVNQCNWDDGSNSFYTNFDQGCQFTSHSSPQCTYMRSSSRWCTDDCTVAKPFVCRIPDPSAAPCYGWRSTSNFAQKCFKTFTTPLDMATAEKHCQSQCGHLAVIKGSDENNLLGGLLCKECDGLPTFTRIGLFDNGNNNYTWTSGDQFHIATDYSNFAFVLESLGQCVNVAIQNTDEAQAGQWVNADCKAATAYTCTRPTGPCKTQPLEIVENEVKHFKDIRMH